ncbi:hypothetical protein JAB1_46440 [Janthinobacterium sp. MP5059B]|uniref:hypothetical protein n=1 Tax=Janthinobacterium sp. MP5059B TaxID=1766683 RepID=UPI000893D0E8|nr:hypothetical protein [Janthinobacterium sp. MP5059B]OEZ46706.1 hypothetical protein JAB1_46440 [Janthinobacterium sp. MP5059B]
MVTARTIISLALEAMNRLAPGEVVDADLAAACLRRLNTIADDWSVGTTMPPQDQIVSGMVAGPALTLGIGDFAAIAPGDQVEQLQADDFPMTPITMAQYNNIQLKTTGGRPEVWARDGLSTIFLYPASSGSIINVLSRKAFSQFADIDTDYLMPAGYKGAFSASLAVAMAPTLIGKVTADLVLAEQRALFRIKNGNIRPAVLSANPMAPNCAGNILQGWN